MYTVKHLVVLDSERIEESIDFTMLCVLFLCLYTRKLVEIMFRFSTSVAFLVRK